MNNTLKELFESRRSQTDYLDRQKEFHDITSKHDRIPTLDEVKKIQELNYSNCLEMDDVCILAGINLVKKFPEFHQYLIKRHGDSEFPEFDLPMSIFATLTRYIGMLLNTQENYPEVKSIIEYVEEIYGIPNNKLGGYIGEFLELVDLYDQNKRKKFYNLLTPKLKKEFDRYFFHYLS